MTSAANRPPLGARVRITGDTGIPAVNGRAGRVVWHHADGVAFAVELDGDRARGICDPENVQPIEGESAAKSPVNSLTDLGAKRVVSHG